MLKVLVGTVRSNVVTGGARVLLHHGKQVV